MLTLNHLNLPVTDVGATRDFLSKYFGMRTVMELGRNTMAMMRDGDGGGLVLNLSHFDKDKTAEISYHKDFHVGFFVETRAEVDGVHARFVGDGLAADPPRRMAGRYSFYIQAPGGFEVEVAVLEEGKSPSRQGPGGGDESETGIETGPAGTR